MHVLSFARYAIVVWVLAAAHPLMAQTESLETSLGTAGVKDGKIRLELESIAKGSKLEIPRLYNELERIAWHAKDSDQMLDLVVEVGPTTWRIVCDRIPEKTAGQIVIEVVGTVRTAADPFIVASPDGGFQLSACKGTTIGSTLRYEPQPHKNTVGYWTQANDRVRWSIKIDKAGQFNVGVLQGCGAGQGGSQAEFKLIGPMPSSASVDTTDPAPIADRVPFDVLETGHFQNFQWRQVGVVTAKEPGIYFVEIAPSKIAKAALMDVRRVELTRIP